MKPTEPLRVALVQGDTRWHDPAGNHAYYAGLLERLEGPQHLVVLPETWATGFTNAVAELAEPMDGPSVAWMAAQATRLGAVVTGSLLIREGGDCFNRLVWMRPDGSFATYDKRHLFRMAREHETFAAGNRRLVVELRGWRVLPLVCYDLRFPAWSRNGAGSGALDYDVALYVANWPSARRQAWRTLLRARAMENLAYCLGVNRAGIDGNGHPYSGDSVALDFRGEELVELGPEPEIVQVTLEPAPLREYRDRFPAWMDADGYRLNP